MEGGLAEAQAAFATLDAQMSRESQVAAKIGDRLHVRLMLPLLNALYHALSAFKVVHTPLHAYLSMLEGLLC